MVAFTLSGARLAKPACAPFGLLATDCLAKPLKRTAQTDSLGLEIFIDISFDRDCAIRVIRLLLMSVSPVDLVTATEVNGLRQSFDIGSGPQMQADLNVAPVPSSSEKSSSPPTPIARASNVALWAICRRHEWISIDPCSIVPVQTCVEARERRCASLQRHLQRRSFSTHFKDISRVHHFIKRVVCQCDCHSL
jgi:hypothetical protein